MNTRDLFGSTLPAPAHSLRDPVEMDCTVTALTELAAKLRFLDVEGDETESWVPLKLLAFRGNGAPRKGTQLLDIERFKAREIGAL